jgi:hypothetical protein
VTGNSIKEKWKRFLTEYAPWIRVLVMIDVAAWLLLELIWRVPGWFPDDVWTVRVYVWSGLLLFDNLCVVWWYADRADAQLQFNYAQSVIGYKPIVFLDAARAASDSLGGISTHYIARNVGARSR